MGSTWKTGALHSLAFTQKKLVEPIMGTNHKGCIGAGGFWDQVVEGDYLLRTTSGGIA